MQENPIPDPVAAHEGLERDVLYLLTGQDADEPIWTIDDLARETGKRNVIDYVEGLHRAGLVHCTGDGHVFASRAGVRAVAIVGHVL